MPLEMQQLDFITCQQMAVQICEQIITGRNYDYKHALSTIQNEEYLKDSDFGNYAQNIKKRHGKVLEAITGYFFQLSEILNRI